MTEDTSTGNDLSNDLQKLLLGYNPDELSADTRGRIVNIATVLQQPIRSDSRFSDLRDRLKACEEIYDLTESDQGAAQSLSPLLVDVIDEEIRRRQRMSSSADRIVLDGISRDLQFQAIRSLVNVTGPELVQRYERATEPIEPVLSVLVESIEDCGHTQIGMEAMQALAALGRPRPDKVFNQITCESFVPALCSLLIKCNSNRLFGDGTRLLAILATRSSEEVPDTPLIRNAIELAVKEGKQNSVAFSLVFCYDSGIDINIHKLAGDDVRIDENRNQVYHPVTREVAGKRLYEPIKKRDYLPITLLSKECCLHRGLKRVGYMASIGEIVSIRPDTPERVPERLCNRVLNRTGRDSFYSAIAIGEILTDHHGFLLKSRADESKFRKWAARVVGEIVATVPQRHEYINESLVERVIQSEGKNCRLAEEALGFFVSSFDDGIQDVDLCPEEVPSYLYRLIKYNDSVIWRTQALGEMFTYEDPEVVDGISESWLNDISKLTGEARRTEAGKLGIAIAALSDDSNLDAIYNHFIDKIHDATIVNHDGFTILPDVMASAEALGIVVSYDPSVTDQHLRSLRDTVKTDTNENSSIAAQALGFIYSLPNSIELIDDFGGDILGLLHTRLLSTDGKDRRLPAIAIGLIGSLRGSYEPLQSLCDEIHRVEGNHRKKAAHTLGEVLTQISDANTDNPRTVFDEFRDSTGDNYRRAVRSLGELAIVRRDQFDDVPHSLHEELQETTEWERNETAQVVGEIVGSQVNGKTLDTLRHRIQENDYRNSKRASRALGELRHQQSGMDQDIPPSFNKCIETNNKGDRKRAAQALGAYIAYQGDNRPVNFDSFKDRFYETTLDVINSKSPEGEYYLRVLGQVAAHCTDRLDYLPDTLCTRLLSTSTQDQELTNGIYGDLDIDESITDDHELAAIAIGEIVMAGDLHTAIQNLGYKILNGERKKSAIALFIIAESGAVNSTEFIQTLSQSITEETSSPRFDLQPYLQLGDTIQNQILQTLSIILRSDTDGSMPPVLRDQIEMFVRKEDTSNESRLLAVDILSSID